MRYSSGSNVIYSYYLKFNWCHFSWGRYFGIMLWVLNFPVIIQMPIFSCPDFKPCSLGMCTSNLRPASGLVCELLSTDITIIKHFRFCWEEAKKISWGGWGLVSIVCVLGSLQCQALKPPLLLQMVKAFFLPPPDLNLASSQAVSVFFQSVENVRVAGVERANMLEDV